MTEPTARNLVRSSPTLIAALAVKLGDADAMIAGAYGRFRTHFNHVQDVIGMREGVKHMAGLSLLGAISVYVTLMPSVLSLIPGVIRACLRIKALIPESVLPGLFLIAAAPLYFLIFLVTFTTRSRPSQRLPVTMTSV